MEQIVLARRNVAGNMGPPDQAVSIHSIRQR
jgi:hypothetical protein